MRTLAIILLTLSLVGCGGGKFFVTEEKHIVVMPPEGLWSCPDVPAPPAGEYTQAEVADYVLRLYQAHQVCKEAIEDVKRYLIQTQQITDRIEGN